MVTVHGSTAWGAVKPGISKRVCKKGTLPENITPENRPLEKEIPDLETTIFRCENVSFREGKNIAPTLVVCVLKDQHVHQTITGGESQHKGWVPGPDSTVRLMRSHVTQVMYTAHI